MAVATATKAPLRFSAFQTFGLVVIIIYVGLNVSPTDPSMYNNVSKDWLENRRAVNYSTSTAKMHLQPPIHGTNASTYLHVGKTGGTTVRKPMLNRCINSGWRAYRRNRCSNILADRFRRTGGEGEISKHVIGYSHVDLMPNERIWQSANAFLFTVRNPIHRFISWYREAYNSFCPPEPESGQNATSNMTNMTDITPSRRCKETNLGNMKIRTAIIQCFGASVESLAQQLSLPEPSPAPPSDHDCWKAARDIFQTRTPELWMWHINPYHYRHYATQSIGRFPNHEVFAIRTEQLWDDYLVVDQMLGGNGSGAFIGKKSNRAKSPQSSATLTLDSSKRGLCCAIVDEIATYQVILSRATNIDEVAYRASMMAVLQSCGITGIHTPLPMWFNKSSTPPLGLQDTLVVQFWNQAFCEAATAGNSTKY